MKDLNYKLKVTPEQSAQIQKALFENGCKWANGSKEVRLTKKPYLIIENNEITFMDIEGQEDFNDYYLPEITSDELLKLLNDKPETKRHKYADLIIQWANDTSLEIELLIAQGQWIRTENPCWSAGVEYRIKPKTITINSIEVPKPESDAPTEGTIYHFPTPNSAYSTNYYRWENNNTDKLLLKRGMVHLTREAALQHAKALILVSGGTVDE